MALLHDILHDFLCPGHSYWPIMGVGGWSYPIRTVFGNFCKDPLVNARFCLIKRLWCENHPQTMLSFSQAGKGILRSLKADLQSIADFIPVDFPVNMLVAVAWYTVVGKPQKNAMIYHITSGTLNPVRWGEMGECCHLQ